MPSRKIRDNKGIERDNGNKVFFLGGVHIAQTIILFVQ